ncbi:uncharacterized protein LOC131281579 [Anopheles ziemanni]|uniref:uncharacterized protein LOC131265668 n=1 Tax=Anopheles coustani TaxID=139045 RepID=UPI00265A48B0|nr:uncharacterized protein LOC131265668 [Anopheles coustani]XP_058166904.1 uncharacterized protein LOC131281579 [Anopheles ziemanni]
MAEPNKTSSRQKFVDAYIALVNKISVERFNEFKPFFANEKDLASAVQTFREGLQEALVAQVNKLWNETDIDTNVEMLEMLKSKAAGNTKKMWRPTGKTVSEQVRPLVVNKLNMSLKFYHHQLAFQKERTEELIYKIETMRAKYKAMQERRSNLLHQIANEQDTFASVRTHQRQLDNLVNGDLEI